MAETLITIAFWLLPALPIVAGVYGWQKGHKAGYDQACADLSEARRSSGHKPC